MCEGCVKGCVREREAAMAVNTQDGHEQTNIARNFKQTSSSLDLFHLTPTFWQRSGR